MSRAVTCRARRWQQKQVSRWMFALGREISLVLYTLPSVHPCITQSAVHVWSEERGRGNKKPRAEGLIPHQVPCLLHSRLCFLTKLFFTNSSDKDWWYLLCFLVSLPVTVTVICVHGHQRQSLIPETHNVCLSNRRQFDGTRSEHCNEPYPRIVLL